MNDMKLLYARLCAMPFPVLGKSIGHFAFYDSLLAGLASRAAQSSPVNEAEVPLPDQETIAQVTKLRAKGYRSPDEIAFLNYFDALEEIRAVMSQSKSL
jgi:hypothetical protein